MTHLQRWIEVFDSSSSLIVRLLSLRVRCCEASGANPVALVAESDTSAESDASHSVGSIESGSGAAQKKARSSVERSSIPLIESLSKVDGGGTEGDATCIAAGGMGGHGRTPRRAAAGGAAAAAAAPAASPFSSTASSLSRGGTDAARSLMRGRRRRFWNQRATCCIVPLTMGLSASSRRIWVDGVGFRSKAASSTALASAVR